MTDWQNILMGSLDSAVKASPESKSSPSPKKTQTRLPKNASYSLEGFDELSIPNRCWRGNMEQPKLLVIFDSPGVWDNRYQFSCVGDTGEELDFLIESCGVSTGNTLNVLNAARETLKENNMQWDEDIREYVFESSEPSDVLYININLFDCVTVDGGRFKVKSASDEQMFKSLAVWHQLICEVIKPQHILLLGAEVFTHFTGKTNVKSFSGVTFDYKFPATLQKAVDAGNQDPMLNELSQLNWECPIDVDLHPAFVMQNVERALNPWRSRIRNVVARLGTAVEISMPKTTVITDFDEAEKFLESWINDETLQHLSYDFETISLNPWGTEKPIDVTVGIARSREEGFCIPTWHSDVDWSREQRIKVSRLIGELLLKPKQTLHGHNLAFDNAIARCNPYMGVGNKTIPGMRAETMYMAYLIDESGPQGLKELCNLYTDLINYEAPLDEYKSKHKPSNYGEIPLDLLGSYNALDVVANLRLYDALKKKMTEEERSDLWGIFEQLACKFGETFEHIHFNGQFIDRDVVMRLNDINQNHIKKASEDMLNFPEMREFIQLRILTRALENAKAEVQKPFKSGDMLLKLNPSLNRQDCRKLFKEINQELEMGQAKVVDDCMLKNADGSPHKHATEFLDVFQAFAEQSITVDEKGSKTIKGDPIPPYTPNFNTNGSGEMGEFFYDHLDLPCEHRTAKDKPSLGEEALKRLSEMHPIADTFKLYKDNVKEHSTYISPFVKAYNQFDKGEDADYQLSKNSVAHLNFFFGKTVTGRTAAELVQLLPRKGLVKRMFASRFEGGRVLCVDESQVELRVFASVANVRPMIDAYVNGEDLHTKTMCMIFGDDVVNLVGPDKKERRVCAKKTNFGTVYCTSAHGLVGQIQADGAELLRIGGYNVEEEYDRVFNKFRLTKDQIKSGRYDKSKVESILNEKRTRVAQDMLDSFFNRYAGSKEWIESTQEFAERYGYSYSPFGLIRRLPAAQGSDMGEKSRALRQSVNFPIQSAASFICSIALAAIDAEIRDRKLRTQLWGAVHDSIELDCPPDEVDFVLKDIVIPYMSDLDRSLDRIGAKGFDTSWLKTPLVNDAECGVNWGLALPYEDDRYILEGGGSNGEDVHMTDSEYLEWAKEQHREFDLPINFK